MKLGVIDLRSWRPTVVCLLAATVVIWWGSLDNGFHYDDEHSIQLNIHLRLAPDLGDVKDGIQAYFSDPSTFSRDAKKGMYRPLLVSSFALNHAANLAFGLDGYDVRGFHVINILIHALNGLLVCWFARLLWPGRKQIGLVAGLVFIAWPLGSEPVNYISSRSESLAALFYLLTMALYVAAQTGQSRRMYWACWLAMGAGLLTKSTGITLPASLLLLDIAVISRFDFRRLQARLLRWHMPSWLLATGYLTLIIQNGFLGRSLGAPVRDGWHQLLTQSKAVGYYVHLLVLPTNLSVEPQFQEQGVVSAAVLGGGLLAITLAGLLLWLWRGRHGRALVLLGTGILHMIPTFVMPLNVYVNDRRAYLPLALACMGIVALGAHLRRPLRASWVALACLGIAASLSHDRNQVWQDDDTLWADAVMRAPQMPRPHLYLGNAHKDRALQTRNEQQRNRFWLAATREYEIARSMPSDDDLRLRALNNQGGVYLELRDVDQAEPAFRQAILIDPHYADALINLGNALLTRAKQSSSDPRRAQWIAESILYYKRGLNAEPNNYFGFGNLGVAMQELGQLAPAERAYRQALFLNPRHFGSLTNLAALLLRRAQQSESSKEKTELLAEARRLVQQSLVINPAQRTEAPQILRLVSDMLDTVGGA
ncbi:MAG: tetratricopeptide repeat protein [Gemmatimonadetes bacterium]|nr:tetratricopeptide repeat protein [Gemmatimonadota bacterium]MBT6630499.1 tetratricopeptide repeat protein [Gemmatimonadota bacterium]MBT7596477.1 tetratricopeptide repeat protein [Gemmatimonadota bacterium]